jgi:hypothetical protein
MFKMNSNEQLDKLYENWHPKRQLQAVGVANNGVKVKYSDFSQDQKEVRDDYIFGINVTFPF